MSSLKRKDNKDNKDNKDTKAKNARETKTRASKSRRGVNDEDDFTNVEIDEEFESGVKAKKDKPDKVRDADTHTDAIYMLTSKSVKVNTFRSGNATDFLKGEQIGKGSFGSILVCKILNLCTYN